MYIYRQIHTIRTIDAYTYSTYIAVSLDHIRTYKISNFIYIHILLCRITDVSPNSAYCCALGPGWVRRVRRRRSAVTTPWGDGGDGMFLHGHVLPLSRGGGTGGDIVPPSTQMKPGADGGGGGTGSLFPCALMSSRFTPPIVTIPAGINRWRLVKLLRRRTVSLSSVVTDAPSRFSLIK